MTITLRPFQQQAANFTAQQISKGETMKFNAPVGSGRTIILTEALKGHEVLFVSARGEMREQFSRIANETGLERFRTISAVDALNLNGFNGVVVLCETVREPWRSGVISRFEARGLTIVVQ